MANLVIGDKIMAHTPPSATERAGEQTPARDRESPMAAGGSDDTLALSTSGGSSVERAPSDRINNPGQAGDAVQRFRAAMQEAPEQGMAAHAGVSQSAVHALLDPSRGMA